ncbi:hypothetical protein AVEN_143734-1 [Araneus ventricosus]|uniref:Uncharacterized protein n=1 Tax=Araneus ventricosus TaxID=182803 RepID=A0A4Y2ANT5_ARAVE|nr:hypothetical protein AVEN_143734-1 [Araneus ventricosus]
MQGVSAPRTELLGGVGCTPKSRNHIAMQGRKCFPDTVVYSETSEIKRRHKDQVVTTISMKRQEVKSDEVNPTMPAQTLTENRLSAARGFSTAQKWALCVLNIPSLVKDALLVNNTLAGKMGPAAHFSGFL